MQGVLLRGLLVVLVALDGGVVVIQSLVSLFD